MYRFMIQGDVRPVNTVPSTLTGSPVVHDDGAHYTASGVQIPAAEVYARRIAREGEKWLSLSTERTAMRPDTLVRKALDSVAFTVARKASSLAVPSKLVGVADHQARLWAMAREHVGPWTELALHDTGDGLLVLYDDDLIGELQTKHLDWVRPLRAFGLRLYLARVTGHERRGQGPRYRLGVNVVFGHVGAAVDGLSDALGGPLTPARLRLGSASTSGDGAAGGDVQGLTADPASSPAPGGDGTAASPLRLVVRPEHEALYADPADVVLWRDIDGTARSSVPHVVRHSPTGIEWGYGGSGPADLARSILLAITDEATADRHYQAFKADVVARVPRPGGVIRAADVRAWIEANR